MTLVFERPAGEPPATHAFVVGVGAYPYAKPNKGVLTDLRAVQDVPSAADSAKLFCDWLIANQNQLVAPLASLEVLISDPQNVANRYQWVLPQDPNIKIPDASSANIDSASSANVEAAGEEWLERLGVRSGDVALFYCCGHGANLSNEPILFVDDLNRRNAKPWMHLHVAKLGRSLKQNTAISSAYIFVDACGETVPQLQALEDPAQVTFFPPFQFGKTDNSNVMLMSAAPAGLLAYDGTMLGSQVRIGRFTQTLVKALDGALICDWKGRWTVCSSGLQFELKRLKQFYFPGWTDQTFEPRTVMQFNEDRRLVFASKPVVPVVATIVPAEAQASRKMCISKDPPPPPPGAGTPHDQISKNWRFELEPDMGLSYALAFDDDECHYKLFLANQPQFELQVQV